jgi:hypothetical protein
VPAAKVPNQTAIFTGVAMPIDSSFYRWLRRHPLLTFLLMTASFLAFGYLTIDLVQLLSSNAAFIVRHGWVALMSGGLLQLGELTLIALLAMACYLLPALQAV